MAAKVMMELRWQDRVLSDPRGDIHRARSQVSGQRSIVLYLNRKDFADLMAHPDFNDLYAHVKFASEETPKEMRTKVLHIFCASLGIDEVKIHDGETEVRGED